MRRIILFLILTITSLASLTATVVAGYFILADPTNQTNNWENMWNGMMNGMMGTYSGTQTQTTNAAAPYIGVALIVSVAVAIVGIGGMIYFFAFPEIRNIPHDARSAFMPNAIETSAATIEQVGDSGATPYSSVLKTMTENERKIVEVLTAHDGKYLQKYIRSETGLTRLQTHRIVARLAERGIVTLEKTGNTNAVKIADWLK